MQYTLFHPLHTSSAFSTFGTFRSPVSLLSLGFSDRSLHFFHFKAFATLPRKRRSSTPFAGYRREFHQQLPSPSHLDSLLPDSLRSLAQIPPCARRRLDRARGRSSTSKTSPVVFLFHQNTYPRPLGALTPFLSVFAAFSSHWAPLSSQAS